jgi:hypothetical protein
MKITFFRLFFDTFFSHFYMINGIITFDKNATETIRKKVKKSNFFGIVQIFLGFFGIFSDRLDNFWTTLRIFWIMVDKL